MNPLSVDLRPDVDVVENQDTYGACGGYGGAKMLDILLERAGRKVQLSPEFVWRMNKDLAGVSGNVGTSEYFIPQALQRFGACLQSTWPDGSLIDKEVTPEILAEAAQYRIATYQFHSAAPADLNWIKTCLAKGIPVCLSIQWFQSMYDLTGPWQDMRINVTPSDANPFIADHECVNIGFGPSGLLVQNSFPLWWGDGGFFGIDNAAFTGGLVYNAFIVSIAGVSYINAGWRPDLTPEQLQVQRAYIAYFGRPADSAGLDYWASVLPSLGLPEILNWFATSDESRALYPSDSSTDIVTAAYLNLFNHAPDAAGLAFWVHAIDSGALTLGSAIYAVLSGALGTDAAIVSAKVEAAGVMTYQAEYTSAGNAAARSWLSSITSADQVQAAVQAMPFEGFDS